MKRKKGKKPRSYNILIILCRAIIVILKVIWKIFKILFHGIRLLFIYLSERNKQKEQSKKGKIHFKDEKYAPLFEIKRISGSLKSFENRLIRSKSTVGIVLGARGSGKSVVGMRIIENVHLKTNKKIYAMGFKAEALPEWITIAEDLNKIENNSFFIIDEGGITFSSRNSMSEMNKLVSNILLISRHKDISVIFITQNSSNLEINTIRQADYLILKPHSLLQLDFERQRIRDIYKEVEPDFKKLSKIKGIAYIYSSEYRGFVSNKLPSFWTENLSKSFSNKNVSKIK